MRCKNNIYIVFLFLCSLIPEKTWHIPTISKNTAKILPSSPEEIYFIRYAPAAAPITPVEISLAATLKSTVLFFI